VAKGLAEGWSVEELSQRFGSTKGTLRTQVKRVLAKPEPNAKPNWSRLLRASQDASGNVQGYIPNIRYKISSTLSHIDEANLTLSAKFNIQIGSNYSAAPAWPA